MAVFVAHHDSAYSTAWAWQRVTDWPRHARYVPFTTVSVVAGDAPGVGTMFVARTAIGRFGFDDPMEVVEWVPPTAQAAGRCKLVKRGSVMLGWAELVVEPAALGSRATWTEDITVRWLPRLAAPATALGSRLLFARLLRRLLDDD